jgi:hypothetical protein
MGRPLFLHQLLLRARGEMVELEPNAGRSDGRVLGVQIGGDFIDDMPVPPGIELSIDHVPGVSFSSIPKEPQPVRRPQPQHHVAAGSGLESELLVVLEPSLELFLPVGKGGHGALVAINATLRHDTILAAPLRDA